MAKKWFVVDSHSHFVPEEAVAKAQASGVDLSKKVPAFQWATEMEHRIQVMDDAGVDMAVINYAPFNSFGSLGVDFCRGLNDGNARIVREYPSRFIGCAHVPFEDSGSPEALHELERAVRDLGLKGVALETSTARLTLDSEELFPLWEKISELDVPIVIHPTIRMPVWGGVKYNMGSGISRQYENTKAGVEVMFGVLNRYPNLKFLLPHHGGALPIWKGRILMSFAPEGWKPPENMKDVPKTPRIRQQLGLDKAFDAVFNKLYFDTAGSLGWMPITEATLLVVKHDRVCFGTDVPFEMREAQDIKAFIDDIKKLPMPEQDKRNVLGENIRNLFKL